MPERTLVDEVMESEQLSKYAGNAAALASFIALSLSGDRALKERVLPALLVRRHVRAALEQLRPPEERPKKKRLKLVLLVVVGAAVAVAVARRR